MSWKIGDDEWLSEPNAVFGSGAVDQFDDRVLRALSTPTTAPPAAAPAAAQPPQSAPSTTDSPPPPPPTSAAFESGHPTPSYESNSFAEPPFAEPSFAAEQAFAEPEVQLPADDEYPEPVHVVPEPEFNIPTLSLGLAGQPPPSEPAQPAAEAPEPPVAAAEPEPDAAPEPEPVAFVIPTLSLSAEPPPAEEVEEELEEFDEVEEIDDPPVRTGDTVIARAPGPPAPEPEPAPQPQTAPPASITESVYDDDDDPAMVIPELVERVDSSELEVMLEDTAVDYAPADPDADTVVEPAPEPEPEPGGFVIPTLARPEPSEAAAEQPRYSAEAGDGEVGEPEPDSVADEVVIPSLLFMSPAEPEPEPEPELEPEPVAEADGEEDEELDEVEPDAIESLDSADLEEVEQPAAAEAPEAKPPAPPEVKAQQAKRRKAWYDDVFAEHFLFLYPLTWEQTCQRDAQFIHTLLGVRDGMTVLDVGCGDGRHAVELAKLGARVTGLDNSLALLLAAAQTQEAAELEDGRVEFIHGDMRRLPRDREFDAVMCIGTTLGYFEEEQNWLCLQEMHDRLAPGGRLLIHVFNRDFIAPHLPSRNWWQGKRCMVIDEAEMNFFANRLRVHRTIIFDDGRQYEHYMFMRAYTVQDLGKAISQLGMRVLEVSGSRDTRGRFYGSASPDIWIVAEKK